MEKLDGLVASHIEDRLLQPERLQEVLASVLDRRQERADRRREHIAELHQRAAEAELRLKRLYDAIESGVADLNDPALKDRIAGLKSIRDQAQAEEQRTAAALESNGHQTITPAMVRKFAATARERIRISGGGYRRDHLRALAQRVEVADSEIRIMGSKSNLLHTLAAASGARPAVPVVRSSVPRWHPKILISCRYKGSLCDAGSQRDGPYPIVQARGSAVGKRTWRDRRREPDAGMLAAWTPTGDMVWVAAG
jgi:hypothetical protein